MCAASWDTRELGMAAGWKPECCSRIFPGPHKLQNSSQPDALGGFGLCLRILAENYMLVMSCLPELALILLILVSPAPKMQLLPWG